MHHDLTTDQIIARGRKAFERGAYDEAIEDLHRAIRRVPAFADVYHLLGLCHGLAGRPESALAAFDRAVELNDRYVDALLNRGIILSELGRTDEARKSFMRASEVEGEDAVPYPTTIAAGLANAHNDLGDMYAEAGDLEEAIRQFRRAAALRPKFLDIRNKLARVLIDLERYDKALLELRQILQDNPVYTSARANLGLALYRMGRVEEAETEWGRCREQADDPQVEAYLRMVGRQRGQDG